MVATPESVNDPRLHSNLLKETRETEVESVCELVGPASLILTLSSSGGVIEIYYNKIIQVGFGSSLVS